MQRLFILAMILFLAVPVHAQAPTGTPGNTAPGDPSAQAATPGTSTAGGNSPARQRQTNPALNLFGMPCSVSLNVTGGVTTSASCGTDPLEVPAQTVGSSNGAGNASSAPASGGTQSRQGAGGVSGNTAAQGAGTNSAASASSSSAGGSAAPGMTTFCSSGLPTTGGPSSAGSILGGC